MNILIDSGSYHALNVGDVAMLQAGVERLRHLWPRASIAALTNAPHALAFYCPGVYAVPLVGRVRFLGDQFLGRAARFAPGVLRHQLERFERRLRHDRPATLSNLIAVKHALARRRDYEAPRAYVRALQRADLVIATGAGVFADPFVENATGVLATLEDAQRLNKPTALMGQRIGPLTDDALKRRMAEVLPRVDLIAIRERRESAPLLASIGVPSDRIAVTGDDALEVAQRRTRPELGDGVGVNVRVAGHAETSARDIDAVGLAVKCAAGRLAASIVAIPIAHHPDCHDGIAIRRILAEAGNTSHPLPELNTPARAIGEVSRCRVVVTGSYHAAVFALAQGIPAVGIAATRYSLNKFAGLAEQFPGGCDTVSLDDRDAAVNIEHAIVSAWKNAPDRRGVLLRAALAQIEAGRAAYLRLGLLASRRLGADCPRAATSSMTAYA